MKKQHSGRNGRSMPLPAERPVRRHEAVWLDGPVPAGYWQSLTNRRRYLRWLGERLGYRKLEDWYRITTNDLKQNHGSGVLLHYWHSSAIGAVKECFPDYDWKAWLFKCCPRSFWHDSRNHRLYMEWLGKQCGVRRPEDWYKITNQHFADRKGGALLLNYKSTISAAIMQNFPDYEWQEWRFSKTPKRYWESPANRKRYMKWLGQKLGFRELDDWYKVVRRDFESNYGNQFIKLYDGSPLSAVKDCYPRHAWKEWKFSRVPVGFWQQIENRKRYVKWLGSVLGIHRPQDWQRIRRRDFRDHYGGGLLTLFRSYRDLLQECLPKRALRKSR